MKAAKDSQTNQPISLEVKVQAKIHVASIPDICHFWYTTHYSRFCKVRQKVRKFATKDRLAAKQFTSVLGVFDGTLDVFGMVYNIHCICYVWYLIFSSPAKLVDFVNIINFENAVHKALRPSISNVIWVLSSDTDTIFQLNQLFSNSEAAMLSSPLPRSLC